MFLKGKKGVEEMVMKAVILIVVAVIMIFVVTAFGAKIIAALFPSGDTSSMKSFDALYNVINRETVSDIGYESTPVLLYLKKSYCVVLFDSPTVSQGFYGVGADIYYAPDECKDKNNDQCICLYDGDPKQSADKKEKNLIKCSVFSGKLYIDPTYAKKEFTDLNPKICSSSKELYIPLIVIGNKKLDRHYTIIINDNDANAKNDAIKKLMTPLCPTDASNLCSEQKPGTVVTYSDEINLDKIQAYCAKDENGKSTKSTSITCIDRGPDKTCFADCSIGDVSSDCDNRYLTCSDFNQVDGGITKYISQYKDYQSYYLCKKDADYCNRGCQIDTFKVYASKNPDSTDGSLGQVAGWLGYPEDYPLLTRDKMIECKLKFIDRLQGGSRYLISYDTSTQTCLDVVEGYFYPEKSSVFICKSQIAACQELISNRHEDCKIKYYEDGKYLWITYYEQNGDCDTSIKDLFEEVNVCSAMPPVQEVQLPST